MRACQPISTEELVVLKIFVAAWNKMNNWLHRMIDEAPLREIAESG
jgi:hypothetical protein